MRQHQQAKEELRNSFLNARPLPAAIDWAMLLAGRQKAKELESRPPPAGAVAFIGSSTFTYWRRLRKDFKGWKVYNGAFGGSESHHQLDPELFQQLVVRRRPSQIVYYCGTNDVANGIAPETARDNFAEFHRRVRKDLGEGVPIVLLAFIMTPNYLSWRDDKIIPEAARRGNALLAEYAAQAGDPRLTLVDVNGEPWASDPSFYGPDEHHLNDEGYRRLAARLRPALAPP